MFLTWPDQMNNQSCQFITIIICVHTYVLAWTTLQKTCFVGDLHFEEDGVVLGVELAGDGHVSL